MTFATLSTHIEARPAQGASLLVIDDAPGIHSALQNLLTDDFNLTFARDAAAAFAALADASFDLVLLSVELRGVAVSDLLCDLRCHPASADLPIILLAPVEDSEPALQGLQSGANDYMTKPLNAGVVRARVNTQLALKRAADENKRTIAKLQVAQSMQENFTRIVSHDLKGPLTNIRMGQYMLRDMLGENAQVRSILDSMDLTLNSMVEMIRVFLDAMDSQQLAPEIAVLNVRDLIVSVVDQYALAAKSKHITLNIGECSAHALADQQLLRQVIANLVSNAVKFSPCDTETRVWAEPRGGMIRICVADQGPGIAPDESGQLFNMFSKLSARPTGGESSTGLGLWIVKELANLQNGRVGVDHRDGGGAIFWVEVPSAEANARKPSPRTNARAG